VLIFIELSNQDDIYKKKSLDYISQINPLSQTQGKVVQVKIMLRPSSFDKDEREAKRNNQVDKLKFIPKCFISFLSIGHCTIKRDAIW
jgi:hypothetical protein